MTLNKFLNKTLDAAKQSALQIYEDDYSQITSIIQEDGEQNKGGEHRKQKERPYAENATEGVVFERSAEKAPPNGTENGDFHSKLEAIREYAARQTDEIIDGNNHAPSKPGETEDRSNVSDQLYSRKDLRLKNGNGKKSSKVAAGDGTPEADPQLYDKPVTKLPDDVDSQQDAQSGNAGGSIRERLNRLESLSRFSGHDFSSHPLFEKLLERGVPEKLINKWYHSILLEGVDPDQQKTVFRSKLLTVIRDLFAGSTPDTPKKILLFCGRSGSGKTRLIMKLCRKVMKNKRIAVASYRPEADRGHGESILGPFCKSNDIPYYQITRPRNNDFYRQEWEDFDHVLIDTPSFREGHGNKLIRSIRELKKALPREGGSETHYVFNSASKDGLHLPAEIEAGHIALTHFGRRGKWGNAMELLAKSNYLIRYISSGPSIYGSFIPCEPKVLANKLIH